MDLFPDVMKVPLQNEDEECTCTAIWIR